MSLKHLPLGSQESPLRPGDEGIASAARSPRRPMVPPLRMDGPSPRIRQKAQSARDVGSTERLLDEEVEAPATGRAKSFIPAAGATSESDEEFSGVHVLDKPSCPRMGSNVPRHFPPTSPRLEEHNQRHSLGEPKRGRSTRKLAPGYRTSKSTKSIKRPDGPDADEYQMQVNLITGAHRWIHKNAPDYISEEDMKAYSWANDLRKPTWVTAKTGKDPEARVFRARPCPDFSHSPLRTPIRSVIASARRLTEALEPEPEPYRPIEYDLDAAYDLKPSKKSPGKSTKKSPKPAQQNPAENKRYRPLVGEALALHGSIRDVLARITEAVNALTEVADEVRVISADAGETTDRLLVIAKDTHGVGLELEQYLLAGEDAPEGSGATDMTLMRHRIRQYSDGVGIVEDNVALIVSIAGQHQRMRALDARVRVCADRINEPRVSPRKAQRAAPTPLAAAGLMLPRWDTGPLWEAARAALNGVEQAQIRVKETLRIVLLSRGAPVKRPIPKLVNQGSGRSVTGRNEYNTSGEGRWARGSESLHMTDRGRVVAFSNELDEYEALVVILERATAALPSKSQEKQLLSPWNDTDSKNCGILIGKLESVVHALQATLGKVKDVSLDGETALMDGASLMFRGQKKLVEMLSAIISTASALLNGLRETEKAKDAEGLRASFSRLQISASSLEKTSERCERLRNVWQNLFIVAIHLDTVKKTAPIQAAVGAIAGAEAVMNLVIGHLNADVQSTAGISGSGRALLDVALLDALDNKFALAKSAVGCIERIERLLDRMSECDDDYSAIDATYKALWKDLEETMDDALALRRKILMEMQDEITPESPVLKTEREMSFEALLGIAEPRVKMLIRYSSIASRLTVCAARIAEFSSDDSVRSIVVGAAHALSEAEAGSASVMKLLTSMYVGGIGPSEPAWDQFLQHVVAVEQRLENLDKCLPVWVRLREVVSKLKGVGDDGADIASGALAAIDDALQVEKPIVTLLTITSGSVSLGLTDSQLNAYASAVLYAEERVNGVLLAVPLVARLNAVKKRRAATPVKSDEARAAVGAAIVDADVVFGALRLEMSGKDVVGKPKGGHGGHSPFINPAPPMHDKSSPMVHRQFSRQLSAQTSYASTLGGGTAASIVPVGRASALSIGFGPVLVLGPPPAHSKHFESLLSHLAVKVTKAEARMDDLDKVRPLWMRLDVVQKAIAGLQPGDSQQEAIKAHDAAKRVETDVFRSMRALSDSGDPSATPKLFDEPASLARYGQSVLDVSMLAQLEVAVLYAEERVNVAAEITPLLTRLQRVRSNVSLYSPPQRIACVAVWVSDAEAEVQAVGSLSNSPKGKGKPSTAVLSTLGSTIAGLEVVLEMFHDHRDMLIRLDAANDSLSSLLAGNGEHPPEEASANAAQTALETAEISWSSLIDKSRLAKDETERPTKGQWSEFEDAVVLAERKVAAAISKASQVARERKESEAKRKEEEEQHRQRLERLSMLQARLTDVASRARAYKLSKRAEPLLAVVKTAEGLADTAVKQNAPLFALNQLESSVQLAERLDKLCHGALHILEKFADVQGQAKDLKEGRPHEPEPETFAELEDALEAFQTQWKAEVDRVSKRAGLESMSAAEQAELDMALRTCDHKLRLAVTAASRKSAQEATEKRQRRERLHELEKRLGFLKAYSAALDQPERGKLLRELCGTAEEEIDAVNSVVASAGDIDNARLDAVEAQVQKPERVQHCLQVAGKPHPADNETLAVAVQVHGIAMSRFTMLHDSMPGRSGTVGLSDREAETFDVVVKEAESALAAALRAAEQAYLDREEEERERLEAEYEAKRLLELEEEDKERRRAKLRWMLARLEDVKKNCAAFPMDNRTARLTSAIAGAESRIPVDDPPANADLATFNAVVEVAERIYRTMEQIQSHLQRLVDVEQGYAKLMDGNPDPPDEDTAYDVSLALDAASDAYSAALDMVAESAAQTSLTQTQAESFEGTVAAAEDALHAAQQTAKKKALENLHVMDLVRKRKALLAAVQKRLVKLKIKLDAFAPEQKATALRNICEQAQRKHDELAAIADGPSEAACDALDTLIETGERVLGFMEQIKLLLKRLVTTEEDLTTMTSQLSSTASSARKTKYIDEAAVAVSNAVKVHVKLELSITNRKGHEKLAMPEVVEFEEAVKLAEAHVAAVRDELRKNSVLPPAEPSAPSSPPVVFKPSQPNSPEAAAVTVTLHIGDVDGALTSITRELAEQKERVRQMLRQSKYIQQCTGAPSKAPIEEMKASLIECFTGKKASDLLRQGITESDSSTASIAKYVDAVSSLQKKTSLLRIIIETVETQITIELRMVLVSTTHVRYSKLLEATIARLYSVRTTVNDFTTKHPSLVDMGFRVQFAYEKAQVVLNEALETLTRLKTAVEENGGALVLDDLFGFVQLTARTWHFTANLLTLVEDQYWAVRELARGKVSVAKLRWTMLRNLLKKNGAAVFRDGGKAASGPGLRSLMDVTQFVSRKKEMMRVFVNRSARQRDHAAVGGKQLRRCGSANDLLHNADSMLNVARRKGMIMHGILTAPENRNVSVLLDDDVSYNGNGMFSSLDYAPLLHTLNVYKAQYNAILAMIRENAAKVPKTIGAPLKAALSACTSALSQASAAFPSSWARTFHEPTHAEYTTTSDLITVANKRLWQLESAYVQVMVQLKSAISKKKSAVEVTGGAGSPRALRK